MIDMLKTLKDVEEANRGSSDTFMIQMWLSMAQYSFETDRENLGSQMVGVIKKDWGFSPTMEVDF